MTVPSLMRAVVSSTMAMIIQRAGLFSSPTALRAAMPSEEIITRSMHAGAVRVNGNLRHALRLARLVDRLADDQPPALEAGMLAGGGQIAFNAG